MTTGTLLRICRKRARLSQKDIAALLRINQSDVSKLEQDKKSVEITMFRDWTKVTNQMEVGIAFLYGIDPAAILQTILQITGAAFSFAILRFL